MNNQPRKPPATEAMPSRPPRYAPPRILRKRSVVDATLQITSTHDPKGPPNPIGGE
jgi:hypothetical protein